MKYGVCCIGHITLDKVVTTKETVYMPGGTAFYFSNAIAGMDIRYGLVTALAPKEMPAVDVLREKQIDVKVLPSEHTLYFENIYCESQDHRIQRVIQQADPFSFEHISDIKADIFHLGPLLASDISADLIKALSEKGRISLDVQGLLRKVENKNVYPVDWLLKKEVLPFVHFLKANEYEMEVLTGQSDVYESARILASWGVEEVIITLGSKGSIIYRDHILYSIPAFQPLFVKDATGCGDTYMAGYLSQRIKGVAIQEAGAFAAAMATLKIQTSGPFTGTREDICAFLENASKEMLQAPYHIKA
jgi:sugar/nucleoside kinase (ribokinase family)